MRLIVKPQTPPQGHVKPIPSHKGMWLPHNGSGDEFESVAVHPQYIPCGGCGKTLPLHDFPLAVRPSCCPFCGGMSGD